MRALVLGLVALFAFILVFPTFRAYLAQEAQNALLRREVAAAETKNEGLTAELARWDDQAYIVAQARERLAYVLPGETAYRVVDPQSAPAVTAPTTGADAADGADGSTSPWYVTLWGSIQVAGASTPENGASAGATDSPATTGAGDNGSTPAGDGAATPAGDGATGAP